jgi:hypothetical protein
VASEDDVGTGVVGIVVANHGVACRHLDLAGWLSPVQPWSFSLDRLFRMATSRGSRTGGSSAAIGGQPSPAARHHDELQRVADGGTHHPGPSPREAARHHFRIWTSLGRAG